MILAPQGEHFSTRCNVLLGSVLAIGLASSVYQYLQTGTTPFQTGTENFFTPQSGTAAGNIQLPFESKEFIRIYTLVARAGADPIKLLQGAKEYALGKGQPLVQDVMTIFKATTSGTNLMQHLWANHTPPALSNSSTGLPMGQLVMGIHSAPPELGGVTTGGTVRPSKSIQWSMKPGSALDIGKNRGKEKRR